MTWLEALKRFNKGKDKFCIPKKGSSEYSKVYEMSKQRAEGKVKRRNPHREVRNKK